MTSLSEFKNYVVFDSVYNVAKVNTLHNAIKEFNIDDDIEMCKYCFYDSKKSPILDKIKKLKKNNKTRHKFPKQSTARAKKNKNKSAKK
jgi:hypothetical protein